MMLTEHLLKAGNESLWQTINLVLFQDINSSSEALGLFYLVGLIIHKLEDEMVILKKVLEEVNKMITVFLGFVITKFGPVAIYGVEHLQSALAYVGIVTLALVVFLVVGYGLLTLIASVGTPAAPGAGAIILFTVLAGMGYQNDAATVMVPFFQYARHILAN